MPPYPSTTTTSGSGDGQADRLAETRISGDCDVCRRRCGEQVEQVEEVEQVGEGMRVSWVGE